MPQSGVFVNLFFRFYFYLFSFFYADHFRMSKRKLLVVEFKQILDLKKWEEDSKLLVFINGILLKPVETDMCFDTTKN